MGEGEEWGKGKSKQQLMLNAFTMEKKYIPLKLSSRFDNRNDGKFIEYIAVCSYAVKYIQRKSEKWCDLLMVCLLDSLTYHNNHSLSTYGFRVQKKCFGGREE